MNKKLGIRQAVAAAFLASFVTGAFAQAVPEQEQNYPIGSAQRLTIGGDGTATVNGIVGVTTGNAVGDVDFYSFFAKAGDKLNIDIDGGMKPTGAGRSVDTTLTLLGPTHLVMRENGDVARGTPLDEGSVHLWDAYIKEVDITADGIYTVAVTGHPRRIVDGGVIRDGSSMNSNGSYTLIISGASPEEQLISIDIKPGNRQLTKINPKSKGVVPVAILSSDTFDALTVDQASLRFGGTGDENSLAHCQKDGKDVNGDGLPDLVCHFDNQMANFDESSVEGTVKGKRAGKSFKGQGILKVTGVEKRKDD